MQAQCFEASDFVVPLYHQCLTLFLVCINIHHHQGVYHHKLMTIDAQTLEQHHTSFSMDVHTVVKGYTDMVTSP